MVVDTKNRGGSTLQKGFKVFTNDPASPQIKLEVAGKVLGYVTVTPQAVRLFGSQGSSLKQTVQISPLKGHPFSVKEVKAQQNQFIRFNLKPLDSASGKDGYTLLVENTKKEPGSYRDTILIKTDSKKKPLLRIPIYGRIRGPAKPGGPTRK